MKSRRQWAIERDRELVEEALDWDEVQVQHLPMRAKLLCRTCNRVGFADVPHGKRNPRFKCKRCGSNSIVYLT